ncbi:hypothetical protein J7E28_07655 [Microbacterium sp. ISL-108]|nr:hypothetical protein [Microbacterium sp. ISL-108]RKN69520.1 hypothetical protein D7252_07685 [Microbacterium sp. CGR2]
MQTMVRTQITVNGTEFFLAQGQEIEGIKSAIEAAAEAGGRFVSFIVVGNRSMSILVTAATQVVISVDTVQFDHRDTGDDDAPYGGTFDLL